MLIRVDGDSEASLHSQIADQVRQAVAAGEVREGERLPSVRSLARGLGVNMHTVLHAYRNLEHEGVIDLRQGRGATVRRGGRRRAKELVTLVNRMINDAMARGLTPAQVMSLVEGRM